MDDALRKLADRALAAAKATDVRIVVAESCTAGLMSQCLSDAEGAATHFAGGFVTYTKEQKTAALNVSPVLLAEKTAVCREVASAMAEGALRASAADVVASITGVAGPAPDEDGNPVGKVCIAVARRGRRAEATEFAYGPLDRDSIRARAVRDALQSLIDHIARGAEAA
jgi:nicotinamide-nucleotide amidase